MTQPTDPGSDPWDWPTDAVPPAEAAGAPGTGTHAVDLTKPAAGGPGSGPTFSWPGYGQPGYGQPGYGQGSYGQPGFGGGRRPRRWLIPTAVALVVLAVIAGTVFAVGRASKDTSAPTVVSSIETAPVFPTPTETATAGATSSPTDTGSGGSTPTSSPRPSSPRASSTGSAGAAYAQQQKAAAASATRFYRALGRGEPKNFCPLFDPADLRRLLKEKKVSSCQDIAYEGRNAKDLVRFTIADTKDVLVLNRTALIPPTFITPSSVGNVSLRKDRDGTWKVRLYGN